MTKRNWKSWARLGVIFTARALAVVAVLTVLLSALEVTHLLRPPRRVASGTLLAKWNIPYRPVDLVTDDGIRLSAWYTPGRNGAVVLLAHSYGDHRPEWVYEMLARKGYGVLAWDARAHGTSGGEITTIGYAELLDVKAALQYALAQPGVEHVGGWGGSMGGATMIRATAQLPQIEALFVDSSFDSLNDELDSLIPFQPMRPVAKLLMDAQIGGNINDVDLVRDIARISPRPVFVAQGTADETVPPDSAQKLYAAAGEPRFLWLDSGVHHFRLFLDNPRRYQRRLVNFFDEFLLKKAGSGAGGLY